MDEPTFGERLRALRRARSLSLRGLERHINHSKSLIGDWENGRKLPPPEVVARLD